MARLDLAVDVLLDRIAEMPDIEAVQEIDLRLAHMEEERSRLRGPLTEERRAALETLNSDEVRLRAERHLIVMRLDRLKWSKAVRAIWGTEGVEQCLVWMEAQGEPNVPQIPLLPKGRRS